MWSRRTARAPPPIQRQRHLQGSDSGLPEAKGQNYVLAAGAFFDIRGGKIARVTTFYNLNDWIAQVTG